VVVADLTGRGLEDVKRFFGESSLESSAKKRSTLMKVNWRRKQARLYHPFGFSQLQFRATFSFMIRKIGSTPSASPPAA
jgi:hypothetical protein